MCCVCGAQIIIPGNTFIGENLFIKDVPRHVFQCGGGAGEARVTDTRLSSKIRRGQLSSIVAIAFITAAYLSCKRQLRPNWATPNVAARAKALKETRCPRQVHQPSPEHAPILGRSFMFVDPAGKTIRMGFLHSAAGPSGILCI